MSSRFVDGYLNPGEISSAIIVRQLEERGIKMSGIVRRDFFVNKLGMPIIRAYKNGKSELLVFKESSWRKSAHLIIGKTHAGYPIVRSDSAIVVSSHNREARRAERAQEAEKKVTQEDKLDLLLWATQEMLKLQSRYS